MSTATGATSGRSTVFVAPFRHAAFAVIWTATLVSNVGGWMYSAASGWLMTSLNPDPFVVALVQVADTLPICLLALPAGALADIFDKRKFLIVVEVLTTIVSAIYAVIVGVGWATPGNLLLFTFLGGRQECPRLPGTTPYS
jgi:MFS family permease